MEVTEVTPRAIQPPEFKRARTRRGVAIEPPQLALLTIGAGVVLALVGAFVPGLPVVNRFQSPFGALFPIRHYETSFALAYTLVPVLLAAALLLGAQRRARVAVSGMLFGIAIESYLLVLPYMAVLLAIGFGGKALLWVISCVGASLVLSGSALLYSRSEDAEAERDLPRTGLSAPIVLMGLAGAAALLAAVVLPSQPTGSGWTSLLALPGPAKWFAIEPFGLAAVAIAAIVGSPGRARSTVGGVLAGLGVAGGISFIGTVVWTGAVGSAHIGSIVGLIGAVGLVAAGAAALMTGQRSSRPQGAGTAVPPGTLSRLAVVDVAGSRESTRLLAAAAQLDARFARRVVRDVLKDNYRAVAPSFGVDLGTVLRHCVVARGRHGARNVLLLALTGPLILGLAHLSMAAGVILVASAFALASGAIFIESWTGRQRIAVRSLNRHSCEPSAAMRYLSPGAPYQISDVAQAESTNIVVYSGYSPFVGSGINQGGWSFAVNVVRGREGVDGVRNKPRAFSVEDLHASVASHLLELGMDLRISDRLYVDGELVRDEPLIVPDRFRRPRTHVNPDELTKLATKRVGRRFNCITVSGWEDELVYTLFLNFALSGASLFADATSCLLLPPQEEHRRVDSIEPHPFIGERLRAAGRAMAATVLLPLDATRALGEMGPALTAWRRRVGGRRAIASNPGYDYGAVRSVREGAQSKRYRRYFQVADRDMYGKILDREIFDAIRTFLADHDIDTSDFDERQAAVLNYGVMVTGGQVDAQSLAVGPQAQSTVAAGLQRLTAQRAATSGRTK